MRNVKDTIITQEEDWYVAQDVCTGIVSQGKNEEEAWKNLCEAKVLFGEDITQEIEEEEEFSTEEAILCALDKGIDDMENGRVVPHEQAMGIVRKRMKEHVLRPMSEQEILDELAESRACYEGGEYMDFDEAIYEIGNSIKTDNRTIISVAELEKNLDEYLIRVEKEDIYIEQQGRLIAKMTKPY